MFDFFKRDSLIFGIVLGLITSLVFFGVFYGISQLTAKFNQGLPMIQTSTIMLISIFSNMFALRYYLIKRKADKTGRGILLITFVMAIIFVYKFF